MDANEMECWGGNDKSKTRQMWNNRLRAVVHGHQHMHPTTVCMANAVYRDHLTHPPSATSVVRSARTGTIVDSVNDDCPDYIFLFLLKLICVIHPSRWNKKIHLHGPTQPTTIHF